jgi:putative membrane protein
MTTAPDRASDRTIRESIPPAREWAKTLLIGLFMGTADGVPGVSGGTIALIAGIYERLVAAITAVTPGRFLAGVTALTPLDGRVSIDRALEIWEAVDGWFLIALLTGILAAVATVTRIVEYADEHAPIVLFGFFFGLIAASALVLLREIAIDTARTAVAALAGFLLAFYVSGISDGVLGGGGLPVVFLAGAIAVSAMILPGISGSLLLVIMSQYTRMTETLSSFIDGLTGLATGGSIDAVLGPGRVVVAFVLGGLVGLFTVARLIRRALDADRETTLAFLVALVVGALRAPVATLNGPEYAVTWTVQTLWTFGVVAAVGAAVVLVLDWYAVDLDLDAV